MPNQLTKLRRDYAGKVGPFSSSESYLRHPFAGELAKGRPGDMRELNYNICRYVNGIPTGKDPDRKTLRIFTDWGLDGTGKAMWDWMYYLGHIPRDTHPLAAIPSLMETCPREFRPECVSADYLVADLETGSKVISGAHDFIKIMIEGNPFIVETRPDLFVPDRLKEGFCFSIFPYSLTERFKAPFYMYNGGDWDRREEFEEFRPGTHSNPVLPPLWSLTWADQEEIIGHFTALLAKNGWPLPRKMVIDGKAFEELKVKPLDTASLIGLAVKSGYHSPYDYCRMLGMGNQMPEYGPSIVWPFLKEFGIQRSWAAWFRYPGQLESIINYAGTLPADKRLRVLVHSAWQGEDAYSIAMMLDHTFPGRDIKVTGVDFVEPDKNGLSWIPEKVIPPVLADSIGKYFVYMTDDVVALRDEFSGMVSLRQGDMKDAASFGIDNDIAVINASLGQSITPKDDIALCIENGLSSLRRGGRLCIDNSAYLAHPDQRELVSHVLKDRFFRTGKLNQMSDTEFERP